MTTHVGPLKMRQVTVKFTVCGCEEDLQKERRQKIHQSKIRYGVHSPSDEQQRGQPTEIEERLGLVSKHITQNLQAHDAKGSDSNIAAVSGKA